MKILYYILFSFIFISCSPLNQSKNGDDLYYNPQNDRNEEIIKSFENDYNQIINNNTRYINSHYFVPYHIKSSYYNFYYDNWLFDSYMNPYMYYHTYNYYKYKYYSYWGFNTYPYVYNYNYYNRMRKPSRTFTSSTGIIDQNSHIRKSPNSKRQIRRYYDENNKSPKIRRYYRKNKQTNQRYIKKPDNKINKNRIYIKESNNRIRKSIQRRNYKRNIKSIRNYSTNSINHNSKKHTKQKSSSNRKRR